MEIRFYTTRLPRGGSYSISTTWRLVDFTLTNPQNPEALSEEKPWRGLGWFNEDLYFISTAADSPSYIDTSYIDVNSKELMVIWPHIADTMVFDPKNNRIALSSFLVESNPSETLQGTYLLYLDGASTKISDETFYLYPEQIYFDTYLAMAVGNELVGISTDGSISKYNQEVSYQNTPRVSPDKRWVIITRDNVTSLLSKNMQFIATWDINVSETIWRTDSRGVFLYDRDKLYYLSIPDGTPIPIDFCPPKGCRLMNYAWLP